MADPGEGPSTGTGRPLAETQQQPASSSTDVDVDAEGVTYGNYTKRRKYVEEIANMINHPFIVRKLGSREECIKFAEDNRMIPTQKECRSHRVPMRIENVKQSAVGSFVCNKGACRARSRVSRAKGTWFENVKVSLPRVFHLMYSWAHRWSYDAAIHEDPEKSVDGCISMATVSDWYNYCRETVVVYQLDREQAIGKIGGPGKIVQIDESKFGKRKNNKGRRVEGHWVLGLIEDGSEDLRLEVCDDNIRTAEVLVPLIKKHVIEGTTIHTDYWRAYDCLGQHGFIHKKVNHSDPDNPFVAPDSTHTQRIESQWRVVKNYYHNNNYNRPANFGDFIVEYLWRRATDKNKRDPFMELIKAINHVNKI